MTWRALSYNVAGSICQTLPGAHQGDPLPRPGLKHDVELDWDVGVTRPAWSGHLTLLA